MIAWQHRISIAMLVIAILLLAAGLFLIISYYVSIAPSYGGLSARELHLERLLKMVIGILLTCFAVMALVASATLWLGKRGAQCAHCGALNQLDELLCPKCSQRMGIRQETGTGPKPA